MKDRDNWTSRGMEEYGMQVQGSISGRDMIYRYFFAAYVGC
jgi:hypothetical protein